MQIRPRRQRLALFRTVYDPARKRGRTLYLGSVSSDARDIPEPLKAQLTERERGQLYEVIYRASRERDVAARREAAVNLPATIEQATAWYLNDSARHPALADLARASRDRFSELLAAMVKAGVGRRRSASRKRRA